MKRIFVMAALVIGIAIFVGGTWRALGQYLALREEAMQMERKRAELEAREAQLSETVASLDDPAVLEREARVRLNYQKEGEHTVVIVPPREGELQDFSSEEGTEQGVLANPAKWFRFIFGPRE